MGRINFHMPLPYLMAIQTMASMGLIIYAILFPHTVYIGLALSAILIFGAWSVWEARRKDALLSAVINVADQLSSGDLTVEVPSQDEGKIGDLMRTLEALRTTLYQIVSAVRGGTTMVASMAWQIRRDNAALSSRTENQSGSLQETAAAIEQLTSAVMNNSISAQEANQIALAAKNCAIKGGEIMGDVVRTMSVIKQDARKAVDIISVIDGIAFQTNILALNAAVEAARAGEHGRGFAVVANEVRNLAQRSAVAAKEIKGIIEGSVNSANKGGVLVDDTGKAMNEIVVSVKNVAELIEEISDASREQSVGINSVNNSVSQIDHMTQQNALLVEEAVKSNDILNEKAMILMQAVSGFNLGAHEYGNAEDTVEMVDRAIDYINENGEEQFLNEVNLTANGQFIDRDLYLWVARLSDGKLIAHGGNPRQLNSDGHQTRDADGRTFVTELINLVKARQEGWVDYKWMHPVTNEVKLKSSYGKKIGGLMIVCGFYKS
jgi:methyl-accepting chemotaxis protein